jgi:uncharacterized protein YlxW (UPF0749 family)
MKLRAFEKWIISISGALLIALLIIAAIHWEIGNAKKHMLEKAKQVEITPEKIDKASKVTGHLLFEVKNFKNKIRNEEQRLQDSAQGK